MGTDAGYAKRNINTVQDWEVASSVDANLKTVGPTEIDYQQSLLVAAGMCLLSLLAMDCVPFLSCPLFTSAASLQAQQCIAQPIFVVDTHQFNVYTQAVIRVRGKGRHGCWYMASRPSSPSVNSFQASLGNLAAGFDPHSLGCSSTAGGQRM